MNASESRSPAPRGVREMTIDLPEADFPFLLKANAALSGSGTYHTHPDFLELQYIHEGQGHYFIDDRLEPVERGSLFLIHGDQTHAFVQPGRPAFVRRTSIIFGNGLLADLRDGRGPVVPETLLRGGRGVPHRVLLPDSMLSDVEVRLRLLQREAEGTAPLRRSLLRLGLAELLLLYERCGRAPALRPRRGGALFERLLEVVEDSFRTPLTLEALAERVGRSPYHISRVFRRGTGVGFNRYLAIRRAVEARRLFDRGDERKLLAVAHAAGYGSLSSFKRNFRSVTGMSPAEYRRLSRSG